MIGFALYMVTMFYKVEFFLFFGLGFFHINFIFVFGRWMKGIDEKNPAGGGWYGGDR